MADHLVEHTVAFWNLRCKSRFTFVSVCDTQTLCNSTWSFFRIVQEKQIKEKNDLLANRRSVAILDECNSEAVEKVQDSKSERSKVSSE